MQSISKFIAIGSLAVFALSLAFIPTFATTTVNSTQYASYSISGSHMGHSFSAIVNESVSPSSASGMSDVVLSIASASGNLSFSKIINSTQAILPYFPTIANQSFTYQFRNYSITAAIDQAGSGSVNFNGKSYSVSNYSFTVSATGNGSEMGRYNVGSMSATGTASVFQSGLVYSANVVANGTDAISIQLLSTNLSMTSQSGGSSVSQTTTSVAVAGGAASILVGVGAYVFYRRRNGESNASPEAKPLYHVD